MACLRVICLIRLWFGLVPSASGQAPALDSTRVAELVGCYSIELGDWTPEGSALPNPSRMPRRIRLRPEQPTDQFAALLKDDVYTHAREAHAYPYEGETSKTMFRFWYAGRGDSIIVKHPVAFVGFTLIGKERRVGQLVGRAIRFTDYAPEDGIISAQAPMVAKRFACDGE